MPVVLRVDGFTFSFYADDHDPPHVHVRYGGEVVIIEIDTGRVRPGGQMRLADAKRAHGLVHTHRDVLMAAWTAWQLKRKGTNGLAGPL